MRAVMLFMDICSFRSASLLRYTRLVGAVLMRVGGCAQWNDWQPSRLVVPRFFDLARLRFGGTVDLCPGIRP